MWVCISTIKQNPPILIRVIQGLLYHTPAEKTVESTPHFWFLITPAFIPNFFIGLPDSCRQVNEKEKPLKWNFDSIFCLDGWAGWALEDFFSIIIKLCFRNSSKCSQNPPFIICAKSEKSSPPWEWRMSPERMECSPNARNSSFLLPCNLWIPPWYLCPALPSGLMKQPQVRAHTRRHPEALVLSFAFWVSLPTFLMRSSRCFQEERGSHISQIAPHWPKQINRVAEKREQPEWMKAYTREKKNCWGFKEQKEVQC